MKKIFTLLCVTLSSFAVMANGVEVNGIYYLLDSTNYTASVTENIYSGDIIILDTIVYSQNKYAVTSIGDDAFAHCSGLASITVPNSVTTIGEWAFYRCSGLASITIPNSVTTIGDYAFYDCSGLASITIPNSVTTIGDYAFENCNSLTSVAIPNSVTMIGSSAFFSCSGLTKTNYTGTIAEWCKIKFGNAASNPICYSKNFFINDVEVKDLVIQEGVDTISDYAFYGYTDLTSVTIGNSVTTIGEWAFTDCSGLTSIEIPNSVTTIGEFAFDECSGLTSVTIPNSVTTIGRWAFFGCSSLTKTNYTGTIADWCKIKFGSDDANPMYYSHNFYINDVEVKDLVIPDGVDTIGDYTFSGCKGLTSVTIPNSVTTIGNDAFYGCSSLTSITIPNSVTTIGDWAFNYCRGLTSITCLAIEPPFLEGYVFDGVPRNIPLYVPASSVSAYQAAEQWKEFEINPLVIDVNPITPDTTQLSWFPVDSASLYKLRIYSEQIELDTTLLIEADSLNGGISIPVSLAPQRVRRMPMDDIGSVVVITLEPNSGTTKETPFKVTVSTKSKDKIDIGFDLTVLKGEKTIKQESGSFALNAPVLDGLEDIPVPRLGVSSGIFDLYGHRYTHSQWHQLPAGIYILRDGEKASKMMKQ